jgi:signal peptidase II
MNRKQGLFVFLLVIGLLCLDGFVKHYTFSYIPKMSWMTPQYPYGGIGVFKDFFGMQFSINHVGNLGAAWGSFSAYSDYLLILRVFISLSLLAYILFVHKEFQKTLAFSLVLAGALGNILDFPFYGQVIDMFYFQFWGYSFPVFNLADVWITLGVAWLFYLSFFTKATKNLPKS